MGETCVSLEREKAHVRGMAKLKAHRRRRQISAEAEEDDGGLRLSPEKRSAAGDTRGARRKGEGGRGSCCGAAAEMRHCCAGGVLGAKGGGRWGCGAAEIAGEKVVMMMCSIRVLAVCPLPRIGALRLLVLRCSGRRIGLGCCGVVHQGEGFVGVQQQGRNWIGRLCRRRGLD